MMNFNYSYMDANIPIADKMLCPDKVTIETCLSACQVNSINKTILLVAVGILIGMIVSIGLQKIKVWRERNV